MKNGTFIRICKIIASSKTRITLTFLSACVSGISFLFIPIVTGQAIDCMTDWENVNFTGVTQKVGIILVLVVVGVVFQWIFSILTTKIANNTSRTLRNQAFEKLAALPLNFYDRTPHGDIISRFTNDAQSVSEGITQAVSQLFSGIVTILGSIIFIFILSPLIGFIILAITPLYYLIAGFIAKRSANMFRLQQEKIGEINGFAEEHISALQTVQSFALEGQLKGEFEEINGELYHYGQKSQFYSSLTNPSTRLIVNTAYICVGAVGTILALNNPAFSIGMVSSLLTYANQYSKPINELTGIMTQLQTAFASSKRLFELIDEIPQEMGEVKYSLGECQGIVDFKNVKFSYVPEKPLIRCLNLHVPQDSMAAIVGPTGSGKTTLVNLLMRFYEVSGGEILIDGKDISHVSRPDLRSSFSMVLQDTWLFEGTIAENIGFADSAATREQIIAAAKSAHAHNFISRLENGYDTQISEQSDNLSQGQKQLISIARAMLTNPPMLILDEATSSVDTLTEIRIQKSFKKLMQGKTSFVIAHRLSTIRQADVILFMLDGDIVEQGSHDELIAKGGYYAKLYNSQFS